MGGSKIRTSQYRSVVDHLPQDSFQMGLITVFDAEAAQLSVMSDI